MSNVFTEQSDVEVKEVPEMTHSGNGKSSGATGIVREAVAAKARIGMATPARDLRKYGGMDVSRGLATSQGFEVSKVDRMSAAEASETLNRLFVAYKVEREEEGVQMDLLEAMLFQHTINGGSVLQPDRCKMYVRGTLLQYEIAHKVLGNDARRFYRAFADETRIVNRRVLKNYDPQDPVKKEQYDWLIDVAFQRGLQRHPDLAHDSSSACTTLDTTERAAVASSSAYVIGNSLNTADSLRAGVHVLSADRVDSTAGSAVPHAKAESTGRKDGGGAKSS